jgi:predicted metal-dependent hydrolase
MSLFKPRYADGQRLDVGGIEVRLKVNRRTRRISLKIDARSGEALAVAPTPSRLGEAAAFAKSRRDWLKAQLAQTPPPAPPLSSGDVIAVLDELWRLVPDGRRPRLSPPEADGMRPLHGCGHGEVDPTLVARAVRREALCAFQARAAAHCERLGVPTPPLSLIDARTRWGSCTPAQGGRDASIRLSWRLALAPFLVADYVVAHECAHLLEANHGPRFWALAEGLVEDVKASRAWLKTKGARLQGLLLPQAV